MALKQATKDWLLTGRLARLVREMVTNVPCVIGDSRRADIHPSAVVTDAILNTWSGTITVEAFAFCGTGVALLTGSHDYTKLDRERQLAVPREGRDIVIGRGAWLASNVTVLGPCRIGEHAVVTAGAVVRKDVKDYEIVGGVPARHLGCVPTAGDQDEPSRDQSSRASAG